VARQAREGVGRVKYADLKTMIGKEDEAEVTRVVREMRERRDAIATMVHSPIVHTHDPYFDLHRDADCIWDEYCRAESEALESPLEYETLDRAERCYDSRRERLACAV
jgi:hypothetical protein